MKQSGNVTVLRSKIHKAVITHCNVNYEGSLEIDPDLIREADMVPYEKILVVNMTNGERLETYVIEGKAGSRVFRLNGAAARRGTPGDRITLMSFTTVGRSEAGAHKPTVVVLDGKNEVEFKK